MLKCLIVIVSIGGGLVGCGADSSDLFGGPGYDGAAGSPSGSASGSSASEPSNGSASADAGVSTTPQAGLLTAGAWDDNRNYELFTAYESDPSRIAVASRLPLTTAEQDSAHARFATRSAHTTLDVALVIDTTGSMGDELRYLQTELDAIAQEIHGKYPNADQRWAVVLYRDSGDEYVVRTFDFSADLAAVRANLAAQAAGGGGDTPEAADRGLEAAAELSWRSDPSTARLVFWVADAPHHAGHETALANAVRAMAQGDVHLYPVAASGVEDLLELTMRQSAQLTGGRYLFLTDDSGIGNAHAEPTVPCYFVTRLDQAMRRMIGIELSGVYAEPTAAEIVRTGGDPKAGSCQLDGGRQAFVF